MAMGEHLAIPMTDRQDPSHDLLTLTQWLSPAFPLGGFAYSHGLETAIADGRISDAAGLEAWLDGLLRYGSAWCDGILLARALAGDAAEDLQDLASALAPSRERWGESLAQGRAFQAIVAPDAASPLVLPVALGVAARDLNLAPQTVVGLYLQAWLSNLVLCSVRAIPLGQAQGQSVITNLNARISELAPQIAAAELDDLSSIALAGDLASLQHETLSARLFKS
ncbi:MAG: urease accessory protein UreF [Mangrovicoccus sp.]